MGKAGSASKATVMASETLTKLLAAGSPCVLNASGATASGNTLTRKYAAAACAPRGASRWHKG